MTGAWLLDLTVGGQLLRYATREVTVTDSAGRSHLYRAGLSDFEMRLDGYEEAQGVEVADRAIQWAQLAARGIRIDRGPAVLRYWEEGQSLEAARVVLDGELAAPEYGVPGALSSLVATVQVPAANVQWPPPQARVDLTTFEYDTSVVIFDEAIVGAPYPTVFGYPGDNETVFNVIGTRAGIPAVPALMCFYNAVTDVGGCHVMVCIGEADAVGKNVRLWDGSESIPSGVVDVYPSDSRSAATSTDLLGQAYTMCEFAGLGTVVPFTGHEYYASFGPSSGFGGGLKRPAGDGPIRELTDVLLFVLRHCGRSVDYAAQEAERPYLAGYYVDGHLSDPVYLLDWADDVLTTLFPITRARSSRGGIYYRFLDWSGTATSARMHLDADARRVRRVTGLVSDSSAIANTFSLEYAKNAITGAYFGKRTLGPRAGALSAGLIETDPFTGASSLTDERILGSPLCARSESLYGAIAREAFQSDFVWSDLVAEGILAHWALRDALPHRVVSYEGEGLSHLRRGDLVTITDSEIALSRAVALVASLALSGQRRQTVELEVLDQRVRSTA